MIPLLYPHAAIASRCIPDSLPLHDLAGSGRKAFQRPELGRNLALSTEERSADVPRMTCLFPSLVSNFYPKVYVMQCSSRLVQLLLIQPTCGFSRNSMSRRRCSAESTAERTSFIDRPTTIPGCCGPMFQQITLVTMRTRNITPVNIASKLNSSESCIRSWLYVYDYIPRV